MNEALISCILLLLIIVYGTFCFFMGRKYEKQNKYREELITKELTDEWEISN